MNIQLIRDDQGFSALRAEWNDLLSRSSADTIFLTWEWLSSWWECYARTDDVLRIIVVRESGDGQVIAILPFYRRAEPWLPFRSIKTLRFIGDGSADSDYLDAIVIQGREEEVLTSVWKWLGSELPSWDLLQLTCIPETSATCRWLRLTADNAEIVSRTERIPCLVADLPQSWGDYLASLKPRFRTKIRSTLRDIASHHDVCLRSVETELDLKAGLQTLYNLHGKRWLLKRADGVFCDPAKRRFYERFTLRFLAQGWLALDFLELDGVAVACQLCFRYRGTQFLLQEGFDPEFAHESVGVALRSMVLKKAIEDGILHYDFLAGLGRHKTQWHVRMKHCETVSLGRRTISNRMYVEVPVLAQALRERVKMILPAKALEVGRRLASS
jgi:CelD/BcsL family acetyltransferase involved in cellulose biosynthesis